jgi:hypothetical protein
MIFYPFYVGKPNKHNYTRKNGAGNYLFWPDKMPANSSHGMPRDCQTLNGAKRRPSVDKAMAWSPLYILISLATLYFTRTKAGRPFNAWRVKKDI